MPFCFTGLSMFSSSPFWTKSPCVPPVYVAGIFSLALLGFAVIRHDFGWKAGVLFSFFSLFTPYLAYISVEIRMYSWAIFSVMLCALYAWRIACTLRSRNPRAGDGSVKEGQKWWMTSAYDGDSCHEWCGVPCRWWLVLFLSSLASLPTCIITVYLQRCSSTYTC